MSMIYMYIRVLYTEKSWFVQQFGGDLHLFGGGGEVRFVGERDS